METIPSVPENNPKPHYSYKLTDLTERLFEIKQEIDELKKTKHHLELQEEKYDREATPRNPILLQENSQAIEETSQELLKLYAERDEKIAIVKDMEKGLH